MGQETISLVFDYHDYREFLRSLLSQNRKHPMSFRGLAQKCGFKSPDYIQRILAGERNLTTTAANKLAKALGLHVLGAEWLQLCIKLELSAGQVEEMLIREQMQVLKQRASLKSIKDLAIHASWLNPILWEALRLFPLGCSQQTLVSLMQQFANRDESLSALSTLKERGYVYEDEKGYLRRREGIRFEPWNDGKRNIYLQLSHRRFLELARSKLHEDLSQREFQGLTLAVLQEKMPQIKERIRQFVQSLSDDFGFDPIEPDSVVRIQCGAFFLVQNQAKPLLEPIGKSPSKMSKRSDPG